MLKNLVKKLPLAKPFWRSLKKVKNLLIDPNPEKIFTKIYNENAWKGHNSISGPGSDQDQTNEITSLLPAIFKELKINSLLDVPCGDFMWMKNVNLSNINYTGGDIVSEIIDNNIINYQKSNINFIKLNIINDTLPKVDLIFCRDCLVHFSYDNILKALKNICSNNSGYFLTTIFTKRESNYDILTGDWRPLNLTAPPFIFPPPIKCINENCTEGNGDFNDKSLGLWKIPDIIDQVARIKI